MTLPQIWSFIKVVEQKSFSRAADELYMSQSTLTKHIQALEDELGHKLLVRRGRTLHMTHEGEAFFDFAVNVDKEYRMMTAKINPRQSSRIIALAIPTFVDLLSPFMDEYKEARPGLDIILHEREQHELYEAVKELNADLVFSWDHSLADFPPDHSVTNLFTARLGIGVGEDDPLGQAGEIRLSGLREQPFVMFHQPVMRRFLMEKCQEYDFVPQVKYYVSGTDTFYGYVRNGKGISFMYNYANESIPASIQETLNAGDMKGIRVIPLHETITSSLSIIYNRKRLSPEAVGLAKYISAEFGQPIDL